MRPHVLIRKMEENLAHPKKQAAIIKVSKALGRTPEHWTTNPYVFYSPIFDEIRIYFVSQQDDVYADGVAWFFIGGIL